MTITETEYKQVGKLFFHKETPDKVCKVLNSLYTTPYRIKIYLGDTKTGVCWEEENDIIGTIGRSTGDIKVPLLIEEGENGGDAILDHCILAIKNIDDDKYLYVSDIFKAPTVEIIPSTEKEYKFSTVYNGELYGNHKTLMDALECRDKLL